MGRSSRRAPFRRLLDHTLTAGLTPDNQDVAKAIECYKAAFRRGDYSANVALAYCFQHGEGVVRNEIEAFAYLSLAAADFPQARAELDKLGAALSADQRAAGQRRAKEMHSEVMAAKESKPLEYR